MTNTELIAKHIKPEKGKEIGICKVCGQKTESGFKSKLYIKDARFTNFDLLKAVDSDIICQNCASCLSEPKLRRSSFIADTDKIIYLQKNDIENYVFNLSETGIKTPFVFCVTESFKKHMSFKATINYDTNKYTVTHENYSFVIDVAQAQKIYAVLNEFYLYFNKDELLSGDYNSIALKTYCADCTLQQFTSKEKLLRDKRGSHEFNFLVYILNSEKRNEILKERKKCRKKS